MENYIVIKSFYKLSEQKNYSVGDLIELSKEDAVLLIENEFIEKQKATKAKK
jgi:hypothetical protein